MAGSGLSGHQDRIDTDIWRDVLPDVIPNALFPARDRFCGMIAQRIIMFEALRIEFNAGNDPQRALAGIVALAHKIAGVAETLGFPNTGKLAAALEQHSRDGLVRQLPEDELWRDVEPRLNALMDDLEVLLDG